MSFGDTLKNIASYLTGEALIGAVEGIQDRIDETTKKVIKASVLYVIFMIGALFLLVGASQFVQAHWGWTQGLGFVLVGVVLVLLGLFAKAVR